MDLGRPDSSLSALGQSSETVHHTEMTKVLLAVSSPENMHHCAATLLTAYLQKLLFLVLRLLPDDASIALLLAVDGSVA